jgi:D-alanine-D-alanine ligase
MIANALSNDLTPIRTKRLSSDPPTSAKELTLSFFSGQQVVLEPNSLGGSFGVKKLDTLTGQALREYAEFIRNYDSYFLVQEYIVGTEYSCGVLVDNDRASAIPLAEIRTQAGFLGYEEKISDGGFEVLFLGVPDKLSETIGSVATRLAEVLGVHTFCRMDFIAGPRRELYFLEMNVLPGLKKNSIYPRMLARRNMSLLDLLTVSIRNENLAFAREIRRKFETSKVGRWPRCE